MVAVAADRGELGGVDRRPADERAVDVRLGHDRRDVAGLHRAAVEHAHAVGQVAGVELGQLGADRGADLLRVLGRRDLAGADGPDRLVGDDDASWPARRGTSLEAGLDLGEDVLDVLAGLADLEALADAEDRREAVPEGRLDLGVDDRRRVSPWYSRRSLWPTDDVGAAELGEEGPADLAGVGAARRARTGPGRRT